LSFETGRNNKREQSQTIPRTNDETRDELRYSGKVRMSFSTSDPRRLTRVKNPVKCHTGWEVMNEDKWMGLW